MSFYSGPDLERLSKVIFGDDFKSTAINQAAYELTLGNEAYRTDSKEGKIEILDEKNKTVEINAGQFALLLTKETLEMPNNKIAFISIKAGEKLKGLINVSGFHVDPGFRGKILFSVYNAGPSTITLRKDYPYFLIWFTDTSTELPENKLYNSSNNHQDQNEIPVKYVDALKRGELASPSSLMDKINNLETNLKNDIKDVERKKIHIHYLLTVLIGAVITLFIKSYWDNKGEQYGYLKRQEEEKTLNEIKAAKTIYIDSLVTKKVSISIDSILNKKHLNN